MPKLTGSVAARFTAQNGRTQLVERSHAAPLKIAKTFRYANETIDPDTPPVDQVGVYIMDCSPGLMAGDHYELRVELGDAARVYVTNQSYTKVHPARDGVGASQRQTLRLAPGAVLEYMPEPLMLYKDAVYTSDLDVYLAAGSALLYGEVICPGRTQCGEVFHYTRLASRMRVQYQEKLIYYQHQQIEPAVSAMNAPGGWDSETHLGNLYVFSDRLGQRHLDAMTACLEPLTGSSVRAGASLTYEHGLVVTVMGRHAWELQRALNMAWQQMRRCLLGLAPLVAAK
ncbi:urease accessory protein UreD [Paenibacillus whitsoniae]|uniref:Urease accessory protein UreD n=1 Tax=Paenibacillus whitsoniae TaxID=2496558 RepID=A0A3S0ANZ3_9BACL|nr:urease accessory protein UreD [Paenibacillus whitsoniae]RTE08845.1 urease accessory protein UreD [Paenibacillus whitsoniae]